MRPLNCLLPRLCALAFLVLASGCALHGAAGPGSDMRVVPRHVAETLEQSLPHAATGDQIIYVDPSPTSPTQATLYALERGYLDWGLVLQPVRANLGRNGSAPPWEKGEGDGRTPSGIFPISQAFGTPAEVRCQLPYRQVTSQDLWVDDPQAPDYNRWARRGETGAASYEKLSRSDQLYRYALVLGYNDAPVLRGLGSAIFLHVERGEGAATAGCVSVPETVLVKLLEWLDPQHSPKIAIGSPSSLAAVASGLASRLPADLPSALRQRLVGSATPLALRRALGFFGVAVKLPPEVERQMLEQGSWRPGCPVAPGELAYLVVNYWGFDGQPRYGELVVHAALAPLVLDSLQSAYNTRFPVERMQLVEAFGADDDRSMAANNTSSFNCREVPGRPGVFSLHSFGAALDLNPRQNPFLQLDPDGLKTRGWDGKGETTAFLASLGFAEASAAADFCRDSPGACRVSPADAASFLMRSPVRPGMLQYGEPVLEAFRQRGFRWGGEWRVPDYQHLDFPLEKLMGIDTLPP